MVAVAELMFSQRKQQKKNYIVLAVAYDLHANIP
jgi:hypothetical protein